ncbi:MAG: ABC transporter ATP-binding protein [Bacteroidia bacterium]|nr:ABC transporter ATP-binding protein [Bacteroidia bacterium]
MPAYFRILSYGKPWLGQGILAIVALALYSVLNAVSLVSVIPFLEILFTGQSSLEQAAQAGGLGGDGTVRASGYALLESAMASYGRQAVLAGFCLFLLGVILLKNVARYLSSYWIAPLEQGILRNIRDQVTRHTAGMDLAFFSRNKKGDLISLLVNDVQTVQEAVVGTLQSLVREPITALAFLVALLLISWQLTLFMLIILPLTVLAINRISRSLRRNARKGQELIGELTARLDEFIGGIRIVKVFQQEAFEMERYRQTNDAYNRLQVKIARRTEMASPVTEVISLLVVCGIIYYGGSLIMQQEAGLKASEFIGYIAVFSQLLAPIKVLSNSFAKIQKGMAAFERISQVLATEPAITDPPVPVPYGSFSSELRFEGVYFRYQDEDVLRDVSFTLPRGQTLALVGPSGSGKSTISDLIPRLYEPYQGQILLDGHDIRTLSLHDLRRQISVVSQEGILFHDTVLRNIAYGQSDPDREAVIQAAMAANAHDFIMELPLQYDTIIGDRGTRLSGGQRQRIAIARALLRNAPILILDEATSNLDAASEKLVQEALLRLMAHRTSVVIAHRLSTISHADQIMVIEQGRIAERGTHEQLLQHSGRYRQLFELQHPG